MSRIWKVIITISVIAIVITIAVAAMINQNSKTTESKTDVSETELMPEIQPQKEYTGYCTIHGKYRQRYVECTGDYDPEAKAKAEAKAKECNESDKAVYGCADRYQ